MPVFCCRPLGVAAVGEVVRAAVLAGVGGWWVGGVKEWADESASGMGAVVAEVKKSFVEQAGKEMGWRGRGQRWLRGEGRGAESGPGVLAVGPRIVELPPLTPVVASSKRFTPICGCECTQCLESLFFGVACIEQCLQRFPGSISAFKWRYPSS